MPRNGSNVYSLPAIYLATTGSTITAIQHNSPLADIAADLNAARPVICGGTGAQTAADARSNLGALGKADTAADSSKLDGQLPAYYRNASNLNAGTVPDARLPSRLSDDSLDAAYLGKSAKAADSNLLDGHNSTYFAVSGASVETGATMEFGFISGQITSDSGTVDCPSGYWMAGIRADASSDRLYIRGRSIQNG